MLELSWTTKQQTKDKVKTLLNVPTSTSDIIMPTYMDDFLQVFNTDATLFLTQTQQIFDVIYIDPPYNTQQKFSTYNDDFSISVNEYKKINNIDKQQPLSNTQEMERIHEEWLNMMYVVFSLLRDKMADDAILFCSLDDNEVYNAKLLCDEIFGPENFVGKLNWLRTETPANLSKKIKKKIEYILCYTKNKEAIKRFYGGYKKSKSSNGLMNQSNKISVLTFPAHKTTIKLADGVYKAGKYGTSSYDIELLNDCVIRNGKLVNDISLQGKFKWSQQYLNDFISSGEGEVIIASNVFSPSYIRYNDNRDVPSNLLSKQDCGIGTSENATAQLKQQLGNAHQFDYPKPVELIEYLCGFTGKNEQKILDVFAGSGTTGISALQHNKKTGDNWQCVLVEQSKVNIDNIVKRIKNE